ncbi:hypothetical protein B0H34DRAFT_672131 [Crassisporium funariophilum]|nr:hypothetical protein B0H34DRAFT_672131 [Crassisporium funariophilum]
MKSKQKAWGKENTPAPAERRKHGNRSPLTISDKWNLLRESITATLQHFFNGNVKYPPSKILDCWYRHPYGCLEQTSPEMYTTNTPYTELKPICPALTSSAVQIVLKKLVAEAESAVSTSSGLHLLLSNKRHNKKKIKWRDDLVNTLATRRPRDNSMVMRTKCPPHLVAANVISSIDYSRSSHAKLLPLPQLLTRMGRQNCLNIGIAATYYEIKLGGVDISAFDLENVQHTQSQQSWKSFTFHKLHKLVDDAHIEAVCILQWISTLVHHIPLLSSLKPKISLWYCTNVAKQPFKPEASEVHPLASSSRNKAITTDPNAALLDFQTGQTKDAFKKHLFPIGGDGLTYKKMVQLKEYLKFHNNDLQSMRTVQPLLEWWHTKWTNLSHIFESYWGPLLTDNPSRLAHSAEAIGHKKPSNLKKVNFYNSWEFAFLVLDACILDCWRLFFYTKNLFKHFDRLASEKKLPSYEDLEIGARRLYQSYTTNSSIPISKTKWNPCPKANPNFAGNQVLARSMAFMRETMASKLSLATAEGDVGRVWEIIKTMVFTFAGCPGHWSAGDFIQGYFNCLLEAVVEHKGVEYGDKFICKTWSWNLHHIAYLKLSWFNGVGLHAQSAKHSKVGLSAEMQTLTSLLKSKHLHLFHAFKLTTPISLLMTSKMGPQILQMVNSTNGFTKPLACAIFIKHPKQGLCKADLDSASDKFPDTIGNTQSHPNETLHFSSTDGGRLTMHNLSKQHIQSTVQEKLEQDESKDESYLEPDNIIGDNTDLD